LAAQVEFSLRFARERRLQEHLDVFGESFKFSIEDANDEGGGGGGGDGEGGRGSGKGGVPTGGL